MVHSVIERRYSMTTRFKSIPFCWLGPEFLVFSLAQRVSTGVFRMLQIFSNDVWRPGNSIAGELIETMSSFLIHHGGYHDVFVCP